MPDHIDKYTDQQEAAYAKKIAATYKKAAQEVRRQITEFAAKHKAKAAKLLQQVNAGEISMADYQAWLQGQVFIGKQWQDKLDDIVRVYTDADEKARQLMRGTVRDVFTESANYAAYQLEDRLGAAVDFHLYDAKTVDRLMRTDPQMLPEWKINEPKDYKWNAQRVRSTLTRAIIEGKPIPDIADELGQQLATGNAKKMVLFARTAMTGAQNAGRVERLHDTQQMGIRVKKKWLAAHDARVRDTHAYLDGQERDVDDDFTVGDMHIAYPGDPTAPPELVYNCRCTMIYVYPEHQAEHQGEKTESYEEWLEKKRNNQQSAQADTQRTQKQERIHIDESIRGAFDYHTERHGLRRVPAADMPTSQYTDGLKKIDDAGRRHIEEAAQSLCADYDTTLQTVRVMKPEEAIGSTAFASTYHNYETDVSTVIINPLKCKDSDALIEKLKLMREKGYLPAGIPDDKLPEYIFTHEFGHTLIDMGSRLDNKRNWVNADYGTIRSARAEIEGIYSRYIQRLGDLERSIKEGEALFMESDDIGVVSEVAETLKRLYRERDATIVSRYSLSSADEFLAESFAAVRLGDSSSPFAVECARVLDKYFRR